MILVIQGVTSLWEYLLELYFKKCFPRLLVQKCAVCNFTNLVMDKSVCLDISVTVHLLCFYLLINVCMCLLVQMVKYEID